MDKHILTPQGHNTAQAGPYATYVWYTPSGAWIVFDSDGDTVRLSLRDVIALRDYLNALDLGGGV